MTGLHEGTMTVPRSELDLEATISVGQTFAWHRLNGEHLYTGDSD